MPTLTPGAPGVAPAATAGSGAGGPSSGNPDPDISHGQPPANNPSSSASAPSRVKRPASAPAPPPGATALSLKMWKEVLKRRKRQMAGLPNRHLESLANALASDLAASRHATNRYSGTLTDSEKENSANGSPPDLAVGHYSPFLLAPPLEAGDASAKALALHCLALFYRSVDARLPAAMRKHGLDAVRRAFAKLDELLANPEGFGEGEGHGGDGEQGDKSGGEGAAGKKRKDRDGSPKDGGSATAKPSDGGEGSCKRMRNDVPESTSASTQGAPATAQGSGAPVNGSSGDEVVNGGKRKDPPETLVAEDRAKKATLPTKENGGNGPSAASSAPQASTLEVQGKSGQNQGNKDTSNKPGGDTHEKRRRKDPPELLLQNTAVAAPKGSVAARALAALDDDSDIELVPATKPAAVQKKSDARARAALEDDDDDIEPVPTAKPAAEQTNSAPPATSVARSATASATVGVASKPKSTAPAPQATTSQKKQNEDGRGQQASTKRRAEIPQAAGTGASVNGNVVDLTIDLTGDDSSVDATPVANAAPSTPTRAIKQNDDDKEESAAAPLRPPPSPASPVPFAKVHNPAPAPQPKPKAHSEMRRLVFNADNLRPSASGSQESRPSAAVSYDAGFHLDGSGACLDDALCTDVDDRLKTWDPFWKIVEVLGHRNVQSHQGYHKMTSVGTRTTLCGPAHGIRATPQFPSSCASMLIDLPSEVTRSKTSNRDAKGRSMEGYRPWGCKFGSPSHPYKDERGKQRDRFLTGDRRLIVRTLPLQRTPKDAKKRADGHLWPKGTFLQLTRAGHKRVLGSIQQRKQQSHDLQEWKGISHPFDLTTEVPNTKTPIQLDMATREIVENASSSPDASAGTLAGSYAVHVAICEYIEPDDLYEQLMGKAPGEVSIPKISLPSAKKIALEYMAGQTVSIVDSDDEDDDVGGHGTALEEGRSLTFSLICPMSKAAMETPVRGRNCKHLQCFDLKNFLHANRNMTGGRWRCGACESFVSVRELVHCGLFHAMVDDLGDKVSGARDKVSLRSDGRTVHWKLMDENRLRYGGPSAAQRTEANAQAGRKGPVEEPEVIDLL